VPGAKAGAKPPPPPDLEPRPGLEEAAALWWRPEVTERELARRGRHWTLWTVWIAAVFIAPGVALLLLSPLTLPVEWAASHMPGSSHGCRRAGAPAL